VWDFLALNAPLPEVIPLGRSADALRSEFASMIQQTLDSMERKRIQLLEYLRGISRRQASDEDLSSAISAAQDELHFLLTRTAGVVQNSQVSCIADMVANFLSARGQIIQFNPHLYPFFDRLRECEEGLERARPGIDPIDLGLSEEFLAIDHMRVGGWDSRVLNEIIQRIENVVGNERRKGNLRRYLDELDEVRDALELIEQSAPGAQPVVWFFHNQLEAVFPGGSRGKAYFLSYLIDELPVFKLRKKDPSFSMPPTLYTNPNEPTVDLVAQSDGFSRPVATVSIGEALYGYVPGTWTYRLGRGGFKTKVGSLDRRAGRALVASYRHLVESGHVFRDAKRGIPGPPGFHGTIDVLSPVRLSLQRALKYVDLDPDLLMIADDDEMRIGGRRLPMVKIPQAYPESWMHVTAGQSENIWVNDLYFENIVLEQPGGELRGEDVRRKVVHPLLASMIRAFSWHGALEVVEYTYSVARTYTSRNVDGAELMFQRDGHP
jgi:hypothetical protein